MNQARVIDVTKIEPRLKHSTIFESFDALLDGDAVLIHNDHDPKPLYYQLIAERGNTFSWVYVQSGPIVWEVEIRKNEANKYVETMGEIVAKDLRKAAIFKKYGLDFCCGGKKTLADACKEKDLDTLLVQAELDKPMAEAPMPQHDFNSWNLSFLSDYIVNVHHAYVRQSMPILADLSHKVADHHGKTNPELNEINDKVAAMLSELNVHLKKEENILFPYIKQLECSKANEGMAPSGFGSIQQPISVMENDHDVVGDLAAEIKTLSDNYTPPVNACNSYSLFYKKLEEFENDLHFHIHLENNILFPKAVQLENAV